MTLLSHSRRPAVSAVTAVLAAAALLFGAAAPAMAAPPSPPPVEKLVALGDSYAAGQGAGVPLDGCLRSTAAYPYLLDAQEDGPKINLLRLAACSGATIEDVMDTQLPQVNKGTTLVTITVGANDLGIDAVYAACTPDPFSDPCTAALIEASQILGSGAIATDLTDLLLAIAERAPRARIVVTDYPIPFVPESNPSAQTVNLATLALDEQIAAGATAAAGLGANVTYSSLAYAFAGHQVGNAEPWLGANPGDPFTFLHPTAQGQAVYAAAVLGAL
ncbi:SGNH/GDSL hydrolase family protein [Agromyces mangrovi Wang et al. 2018]|uniref:SGNH/GDSL hydrolase family protein n=1 Tax=Agromyces mangrovi TaxID=1858653 RepID=UPI00257333E6|nr:SGNH/GDSL hydrolase family protein [Agromyces mangrovi]BDZ65028.1 lipase 1 [Agromyces mangrovi]